MRHAHAVDLGQQVAWQEDAEVRLQSSAARIAGRQRHEGRNLLAVDREHRFVVREPDAGEGIDASVGEHAAPIEVARQSGRHRQAVTKLG